MNWKNALIKTLIYLFKKSETLSPNKESFLIVSTTGLGDTLWGTPAIRELRKSYPKCHISVLTSRLGKEVLQDNPHIDEFFVVSDSLLSFVSPLLKLRKKRVGTAFIFHTSQRFALPLCALCSIPKIIGTRGLNKGLDSLLTKTLKKKREHEIERRLEIVKEAGAKITNPLLEINWAQESEDKIKESLPTDLPLIGLHPGAKDLFKQYPPSYFAQLGNKLAKKHGCRIVITGGPDEKELVQSISSQIKHSIPLAGQLTIAELAALIHKFSLFITNDTGPMHIAFAIETPTIALFSPTDPKLCGPYKATQVKVLYKPPTCRPCLKKKCLDPFCLRQIPQSSIMNASEELLNAH